MIVRLDLKDGAEPVANVHNSGVLSRPLHHILSFGGKALQVHAAGFVRAMLTPHHAEDTELGEVGIASEDFLDAGVFFGREAVFGSDLRRYFDFSVDHFTFGQKTPRVSRFSN